MFRNKRNELSLTRGLPEVAIPRGVWRTDNNAQTKHRTFSGSTPARAAHLGDLL